jgi:hypothetical protein
VTRKADRRLTATSASKSSAVRSSIARGWARPALLTRTSTSPGKNPQSALMIRGPPERGHHLTGERRRLGPSQLTGRPGLPARRDGASRRRALPWSEPCPDIPSHRSRCGCDAPRIRQVRGAALEVSMPDRGGESRRVALRCSESGVARDPAGVHHPEPGHYHLQYRKRLSGGNGRGPRPSPSRA